MWEEKGRAEIRGEVVTGKLALDFETVLPIIFARNKEITDTTRSTNNECYDIPTRTFHFHSKTHVIINAVKLALRT